MTACPRSLGQLFYYITYRTVCQAFFQISLKKFFRSSQLLSSPRPTALLLYHLFLELSSRRISKILLHILSISTTIQKTHSFSTVRLLHYVAFTAVGTLPNVLVPLTSLTLSRSNHFKSTALAVVCSRSVLPLSVSTPTPLRLNKVTGCEPI